MHHQNQLELLKLLLEVTRKSLATWQPEGTHNHHAEFSGLRCSLRFKYPMLAGDDGSDADAVEVVFDGTVLTFYSGSEGFDLVADILAAAYPDFNKHAQRLEEKLIKAIEKIRVLVQP